VLADTIEAKICGKSQLSWFKIKPEILKYTKEFSARLLDVQPTINEPKINKISVEYEKVI